MADAGDYAAGAQIALKGGGGQTPPRQPPLSVSPWNSIETTDLHLQLRGQKCGSPPVVRSYDKRQDFYDQLAYEVQHNLSIVALADKRGLPDPCRRLEITTLLSRGKQLLDECPTETGTCQEALEGIPLLEQAAERAKKAGQAQQRRQGLKLLSRAQILGGSTRRSAGGRQPPARL
jgi:hypothetical protein